MHAKQNPRRLLHRATDVTEGSSKVFGLRDTTSLTVNGHCKGQTSTQKLPQPVNSNHPNFIPRAKPEHERLAAAKAKWTGGVINKACNLEFVFA